MSKTYLAITVGVPKPGEATAGASYAAAETSADAAAEAAAAPGEAGAASDEPAASAGAAPGSVSAPGLGPSGPAAAASSYPEVTVREPIGRHPTDRQRMGVVPNGRSALSVVAPIATDGRLSLCRVKILTGRTHQIRVRLFPEK